jgi:hypothetical protein
MKLLLLSVLAASCLCAQDISVVVHDPAGVAADTPLASTFQFPNAPVGGSSQIVLRFSNHTSVPMTMLAIVVGNTAGSLDATPNFSVTGQFLGKALAANGANFEDVTVTFTPTGLGALKGYLQAAYEIEQNGCNPNSSDPATQCSSTIAAVSTLSGNGIAPQWLLTYNAPGGPTTPQPNSATPISFGNVSTSSTSSLTFTFSNVSASVVTLPPVSLISPVYFSTAFELDTSKLPLTLPPGSSASFSVTFAPGQVQQENVVLAVGVQHYPLTGNGVVETEIDALQIAYTDSAGVRTLPNPATPITFDQVIAGMNGSSTLTFTVSNPATSYNAISIPQLSVTGVGFKFATTPAVPASIASGDSITFQVVFAPTETGTYIGTLAIGSRQFPLKGKGIASAVPAPSFQLSESPLTSQKQVTLSIQLADVSTVGAIGQLTMSFTPSVNNVRDDPAICFLATSGRNLQVDVVAGEQTATYQGQSALTFQTGSTAGTLTFTLTFPNGAPLVQSFTIAPEPVQITSITAVRSNPNLIVTITGFDNTYSAGKLSFTFSDLLRNVITAAPIAVDATTQFANYFFTNNQAGGAFAMQATFPVTGDITQIGSFSAQIKNSSGMSTAAQNFQ